MSVLALSELADYVVPFYVPDARGNPQLLGSAVPIQISDQYFLATAAHVLDQNDAARMGDDASNLYLPLDLRLEALPSVPAFKTSVPPSGRREDDLADVAILALPPSVAKRLAPRRFLLPRDFAMRDHLEPASDYVFSGFPAAQNGPVYGTTRVRSQCLAYFGRWASAADARDPRIAPHLHVLARFDRRRVRDFEGQTISAPDPKGMSGGPVWVPPTSSAQAFRVVGIGIEHRSSTRLLVGTRLTTVVAAIIAEYPHLEAFLPAIEGVNINMRPSGTAGA
jgi:hypothetical protein